MTGKLLIASSTGNLAGWTRRLLFSASEEDGADRSRFWFVRHARQRIPKLLKRRRQRKHKMIRPTE
jgi:hypothetical protein